MVLPLFTIELGNVDSLRGKFKKSLSRTSRNLGQSHQQNQRLKQAASTGSASGSGSEGAQMSGYLRKKQKNGAKWKRLWFVLRDGILYAFKAPEDLLPADTISIMGYKLEILSEVRFCQLFCINLIVRLTNVHL